MKMVDILMKSDQDKQTISAILIPLGAKYVHQMYGDSEFFTANIPEDKLEDVKKVPFIIGAHIQPRFVMLSDSPKSGGIFSFLKGLYRV